MNITIVIPVYNGEKYIERCLNSLNGFNGEIIVINDGSNDNTLDILNKYKNITIYTIPNQGLGHARNYGISKATKDYIMYIDADDYLSTIELFNDIVFNDEDIIYFNKDLDENITKEELFRYIVGMKKISLAGAYCKLYKKSFLIDNNIEYQNDLVNGEDMLFNSKCISLVNKYKIISQSFYMYRITLNSMSRSFNDKIFDSDKKFNNYLKSILDNSSFDEEFKLEISNYVKFSAVMTLMDRISYLKDYKEFKNKIKLIDYDFYKDGLNCKINYKSYKWFIFKLLLKLKMYHLIYLLLILNHNKKSDYFVEI